MSPLRPAGYIERRRQWRALAEGAGAQLLVFLVHDHDAVAAALLRVVERFIGELDETVLRAARLRHDARRTDTDRQPLDRSRGRGVHQRQRFDLALDAPRCFFDMA